MDMLAANCEGGHSFGLHPQTSADYGVVISHEFVEQIFLIDVRLTVHIRLSALLQHLIHSQFAEDLQHCRLFGRVVLFRGRGVARSAGQRQVSPAVAPAPLSPPGTGVVLRVLQFTLSLGAPVLELSATIFGCSKDGPDVVVLSPVITLARFNWCQCFKFQSNSRNYSILK